MIVTDLDAEDDDIPQLAVAALNAATRRAIQSARSVVLVDNGELVRIAPEGKTVLKKLPPRTKVSIRIKRATS